MDRPLSLPNDQACDLDALHRKLFADDVNAPASLAEHFFPRMLEDHGHSVNTEKRRFSTLLIPKAAFPKLWVPNLANLATTLLLESSRYMLWKQCLLLSTYLRRTFTCTLNLSRHLATSPPRHFAISPSCYLATFPSRYLATSPSCHLGPA